MLGLARTALLVALSLSPAACQSCSSGVERPIIDISLPVTSQTPSWDSQSGVGEFRRLGNTFEDEMPAAASVISQLSVHTGTHIDAPSHFVKEYFDRGLGIESLDLGTLNGPALVIDAPRGTNITAKVLQELNVPKGVVRVLFKTDSSDRNLYDQPAFQSDYTSITTDGSQWLVDNTDWRLIGGLRRPGWRPDIDYLGVSTYDDCTPGHQIMLGKEIIQVEGLVLKHVEPGLYDLHCLPVNIVGSDGAPARCILIG